ncbi:MAG: reverse transcriptase family protein [Sulfurovum sp.]|nr:reverse transcriptase family protein [Sulfurovum sp.]
MNLNQLNSLDIISKSFNIPLKFLQSISKNEKNIKYIELFDIPKKNPKRTKKYREVIKINSPYNLFYKELLHIIEQEIEQNKAFFISNIAHGFIKERGVLTNAKQHLNKKYLFKIDIKNYFKSITKASIKSVFLKLRFSENGAEIFSDLCTFEDVLYEGFNTSPILANLYCLNLDLELKSLADEYKVGISRYSDDITFSSNNNNFPPLKAIQDIFDKYNFKINEEKTISFKYGQPQYVTGLSISNNKYPRVPKRMKRKIRQELYYLNKYPENYFNIEDGYARLRAIYGKIVYIIGIEKILGKRYQSDFINILENNNIYLENLYMDAPQKKSGMCTYHYIDESETPDKKTLILSLVSINGNFLKNTIFNKLTLLQNDLVSDLRNGLTDNQKSKLFHYCEDNITVKERYISILRELNIEAQIMFKSEQESMDKLGKEVYQNNYYALFNSLMKNILRRYKNNTNMITVEENSKISLEKLKEIVLSKGSFFPNTIIEKSGKDDILLSIPDYILGIVRDCMENNFSEKLNKLKTGQTLKENIKLNEISDKIRLIADLTNNQFFTQQNNNKMDCLKLNDYIHNKTE